MDVALISPKDVTFQVNLDRRSSTTLYSEPTMKQPAEPPRRVSVNLVEPANKDFITLPQPGFETHRDSITGIFEDHNGVITPPNGINENTSNQTSELPFQQRRELLTEISANRGNPMDNSCAALPEPSMNPKHPPRRSSHLYVDGIMTPPDDTMSEPVLPPGVDDHQDLAAFTPALVEISETNEYLSPAARLRRQLERTNDLIVCPGVYDGFSARIAISVGFDAMYMTGAGTTASRLGQPDLGLAQLSDMRLHADMICNLNTDGPPVIADMDTGYGGPNTVALAVQQYVRANVAGFHIEDQVLTKRCGHLSGKKVVATDIYLSRIRAAKAAKDKLRSDIVLIARTDANQQLGYDECISRLKAARDLGADVGLLEGFKSKAEAAQAVKDLAPWPLLLNIVENGHSPLISVDEAREMGFRIMIFSFAALAPAFLAIKATYQKLKTEGVTGIQGSGVNPRTIFDVCGLGECMSVDEAAGGEDFKGGV